MPVFINYSREDQEFVQRLAMNLVRRKAHVWLDEWEVTAGESLIEKIQTAIQSASALIAVFSPAAIASVWCKREVTAAIQRELEEKRIIVIPVVLQTCEIPLFLRDKKYADFRKDFDAGLSDVLAGIAKVTNSSLGRVEGDEYHTDWSIDWGYYEKRFVQEFHIVQHSKNLPYSVLSRITVFCSEEATDRYRAYEEAGFPEMGRMVIAECVIAGLDGHEFNVLLEDSHRREHRIDIEDPNTGIGYAVHLESRRLGEDTGKDILMHGADEIRKIWKMASELIPPLTPQQQKKLWEVVKRNQSRNRSK